MIFNMQGSSKSVPVPNSYNLIQAGMAPNCVIRPGDFIYYGSVNFGTEQSPTYYDAFYPIDYYGSVITSSRYVGIAKTGGTSVSYLQPTIFIQAYMQPDTPTPTP